MDLNSYKTLVNAMLEHCKHTLFLKNEEYTEGNPDVLVNFKRSAATQGITPVEALRGMMTKHVTSIYDMMGSGKTYTPAQWNEKIGDNINYLLLLKCLVSDVREEDDVQ